ncbi:MAG TPA: hypothetical protein VIQ24_19270 [Pyrinomonadaceae bacterium]
MKKDTHDLISPKFASLLVIVTLCALSVGFNSCSRSDDTRKQFTAAEVSEIQAALKNADPATYRVVVPRYDNDKIAGSQTLGTLTIADVRRVASQKGIKFEDNGNLQAIFMSTPGSEDTSKASSQTGGKEASNETFELGRRLEAILANKDQSAFVLIR